VKSYREAKDADRIINGYILSPLDSNPWLRLLRNEVSLDWAWPIEHAHRFKSLITGFKSR
jgi:hypothetical protein